jgi:exodeoxyribonuclease V beta subunit
MRGFIDLLFQFEGRYYLVDWKSNWLGPRPADYSEQPLRAVMLHSFYFLQYHLYAVAADLFLTARAPGFDYARDFGGVFYMFLRGVDPTRPGNGIFHDRPDAGLIRDLRETLTGGRS